MNIAIFESVTTESALLELEAEGVKYDGLYVDMYDAPQRKYVKEKAAEIQGLIKKVGAHRIADKKAYGVKVEAQAAAIIERLSAANSNFQVLIDDYTIERKKILDAEKARVAAIELQVKFDNDHEFALIMDENHAAKVVEELRLTAEREEQEIIARDTYTAKQVAIAEERQRRHIEVEKQNKINAEDARLANTEHLRSINNRAVNDLMGYGASCDTAKAIVSGLAKKQILNITINY